MFTGIVEELGEVLAVEPRGDSARVTVRGPLVVSDAERGASIAVDGVCLTVVAHVGDTFSADVMAETLGRTTLGSVRPGCGVNLERPLKAQDRLGGHIVQGHVDGTAVVLDRTHGDAWDLVRFSLPASLARYVVQKGSVTVDGVSLTAVDVGDDWFSVGLVPTTLAGTTLGGKQPGDAVNLEVDVVAKYVEKLVAAQR